MFNFPPIGYWCIEYGTFHLQNKTKKMKTNINHHDKSIHSDGIWHRDLFIKNSYPADCVDCFHQWVAGDAGVGSHQVCRRKRRKRAGVAADRPTTCCSFMECLSMHASPYPYHTMSCPRFCQDWLLVLAITVV